MRKQGIPREVALEGLSVHYWNYDFGHLAFHMTDSCDFTLKLSFVGLSTWSGGSEMALKPLGPVRLWHG
jgi:hypothetical protein